MTKALSNKMQKQKRMRIPFILVSLVFVIGISFAEECSLQQQSDQQNLHLAWNGDGCLQVSPDLVSWTNIIGAVSPYDVSIDSAECPRTYYRICELYPEPLPWLTITNGHVIVEATGTTQTLRGINIDMFFYVETNNPTAVWNYVDAWTLDMLENSGANFVRLCLNDDMLAEWDPVRLRQNNLKRYKTIIKMCAARGIYVMLDLHCPPGCEEVDIGDFWQEPAFTQNRTNFLDLWRVLAAEFADNPGVIGYDLFNEPRPPDEDAWWELVDDAVAAIREVDTRHIIAVETPLSCSRTQAFQLVDDPLILYSFHFYEPLAVTHRGADWTGDTPMPTNAVYPGESLAWQTESTYANPQNEISGTHDWTEVSTLNITAPAYSGYATIIAFARNGAADVYFDDFSVTRNGQPVELVNGSITQESPYRVDMPLAWFANAGDGYYINASRTEGCAQPGSIHISGSGTLAYWHQYNNAVLTAPLIKVTPGDVLDVRAMAKSTGSVGTCGVTLLFYNPHVEYYDRAAIKSYIETEYTDWLTANNVPGYVGEFGCMSTDQDASAYSLITDMASIWDEKGMPWTSWTLRDWKMGEYTWGFGILQVTADMPPAVAPCVRASLYNAWTNALR